MNSELHTNPGEPVDFKSNLKLLQVERNDMKTMEWVTENGAFIEQQLKQCGALLVRGLNVSSSKQFAGILERVFGGELIDYTYRSTPRTELKSKIYTTTEYHADKQILLHNENAYSNQWPLRIGFLCMLPSQTGGETPICDSRVIYKALPKEIVEEFERKKVRYVRNYGSMDLPWSEVFQTDNKKEVEHFCQLNNIGFEWTGESELRTFQINEASKVHPHTKEKVWFNQAHLYHITSLDEDERNNLLTIVGEDCLPRNAYFGDGTDIDPQVLDIIRNVYKENIIAFPWQKNDLLLLDNMLFAHGRNAYSGERKVLVGMSQPFSAA
ncbi:TauD/TfdA family dioxygenase [Pseudoalteromonas rubra]|uniref:Taurine catabolism dioxygenase TauD n=1 Tax=Pseudoalteromonas rubra TaxID=43658 RepID=A0A0F4QV60_9GAMM|nr:TauD/TfdA family dioxygenase [Pseudoalteromonas rubra]KJZ11135.1 taurine catabolism dioxygenase TauD [Pseudoalteromonas rubra]